MILRVLAALVVLAELVGSAVFFLTGPWLLGVGAAVLAVCTLYIGAVAWRSVRPKQPAASGYVVRENTFW